MCSPDLVLLLMLVRVAPVAEPLAASGWVCAVAAVVVLSLALGFSSPFVGHTFPRLGPHSRRGPWLGRVASRPVWIESMTLLPEVESCAWSWATDSNFFQAE